MQSWFFIGLSKFQKKKHNLIVIELHTQQALDTDPKAVQKFNFSGNLDCGGNISTFFTLEEKKRFWIFLKELYKYYIL